MRTKSGVRYFSCYIWHEEYRVYLSWEWLVLNNTVCACDMKTDGKSDWHGNTFIERKIHGIYQEVKFHLNERKWWLKIVKAALSKSLRFASSNFCLASPRLISASPRLVLLSKNLASLRLASFSGSGKNYIASFALGALSMDKSAVEICNTVAN